MMVGELSSSHFWELGLVKTYDTITNAGHVLEGSSRTRTRLNSRGMSKGIQLRRDHLRDAELTDNL